MVIGSRLRRIEKGLSFGGGFLLPTAFLRLALRLGFLPFPIPLGAFNLGQFSGRLGAPCFGNAASPAAESASGRFIGMQDVPTIWIAVAVDLDPLQDTIGDDFAGIVQPSGTDRLAKLKNNFGFSSIIH